MAPPLQLSQKTPKSAFFAIFIKFLTWKKIENKQIDAFFDALLNGHSGISGKILDIFFHKKNIDAPWRFLKVSHMYSLVCTETSSVREG